MSAFVIHGVSRSQCLEAAKKKINPSVKIRPNKYLPLSEAQWEMAVGLHAAWLYGRGVRSKHKAISPRFASPHAAEKWLELARHSGDVEHGELFAYQQTKERDPSTRAWIYRWLPYKGEVSYQADLAA